MLILRYIVSLVTIVECFPVFPVYVCVGIFTSASPCEATLTVCRDSMIHDSVTKFDILCGDLQQTVSNECSKSKLLGNYFAHHIFFAPLLDVSLSIHKSIRCLPTRLVKGPSFSCYSIFRSYIFFQAGSQLSVHSLHILERDETPQAWLVFK